MARIGRPIYKRHFEYVAVRPIRLNNNTVIEPGKDVKLRPHQMRSLYLRRRIGPKGHPWTEHALKTKGFPSEAPKAGAIVADASEKPEAVNDGLKWLGEDGQRYKTKGEAAKAGTEATNDKLTWAVGEARFQTKKEAVAFIAENWPDD